MNHAAASDADLARAVQRAGDDARAAETELCRRFAPRIHAYGRRHLRDAARCDDLVQTVLMTLLEALRGGRVDELAKLERYVLGVCRNAALTEHKSTARLALESAERLLDIPAYDREVIDERALTRCLYALEPRARQVVMLSFSAEESPDAIAAALQTSVANVRVLRHRAVAALRRCLDVGPSVAEAGR